MRLLEEPCPRLPSGLLGVRHEAASLVTTEDQQPRLSV